jgi:proteic killer suppression protein
LTCGPALAHILSSPVILSFADKPTEALWQGRRPAELPPSIHKTALRKLTQLEAASSLNELRIPPGNRLEALKGRRTGQHSIRVNDQYRVCFRWDGKNAERVEITDYH